MISRIPLETIIYVIIVIKYGLQIIIESKDLESNLMHRETKRLVIRNLQSSDINSLLDLWTDPDVMQFMGGPRDRDILQKTLQELVTKNQFSPIELWVVIDQTTQKVVGNCGLMYKTVDLENELEVVYLIHKKYWKKGLATEACLSILDYAFNELNEKKVIALIHTENPASEKVAKKIGMRLEKETLRPSGIMMKVYKINKMDFIHGL